MFNTRRLVMVWYVVFLVLAGLSGGIVNAQDGPEMTTCSSADGVLTLSYPAGWFVEEASEDSTMFVGAMISNSKELVGDEAPILKPGQAQIALVIFSGEFLSLMGVNTAEDLGSDFIADFARDFQGSDSSLTMGEPEMIELAGGVQAGYIAFTSANADGAFIGYEKDSAFIFVYASVFPGEYADDMNAIVLEVVASIKYATTPDGTSSQALCADTLTAESPETDTSEPDTHEGDTSETDTTEEISAGPDSIAVTVSFAEESLPDDTEVEVELSLADSDQELQAETDELGHYVFSDLQPGEYSLTVVLLSRCSNVDFDSTESWLTVGGQTAEGRNAWIMITTIELAAGETRQVDVAFDLACY